MPPTPKGRDFETKARGLRDFAGLRSDTDRLDPFSLARFAGLVVVPFEQVAHLLPQELRDHLVGGGKDKWSGGAVSQPLPDGGKLIILNPTHGKNRHNATLMEEISHVFLGHEPSRLGPEAGIDSGSDAARDYRPEIEQEAYGVGAAALVPYTALVRFVGEGKGSKEIARHFGVSRDLVDYRLRVSLLWEEYTRYNERWGGRDR
jgi:hypothetical protein